MGYFDVVLHARSEIDADPELTSFVTPYHGTVRYVRSRDGRALRAGSFLVYHLHAGLAVEAGRSLFEVCDAESQDMHEIYAALFDPCTDSIDEAIGDRYDAIGSDLLVLDHLVLHPRWRGLKLGLLVTRKIIDLLGGGCALAVSRIAPLCGDGRGPPGVPDAWIPRHATPEDRADAARKLRRYFRRMGFRRLAHTPFSVMSMARRNPSPAELIRPRRPRRSPRMLLGTALAPSAGR